MALAYEVQGCNPSIPQGSGSHACTASGGRVASVALAYEVQGCNPSIPQGIVEWLPCAAWRAEEAALRLQGQTLSFLPDHLGALCAGNRGLAHCISGNVFWQQPCMHSALKLALCMRRGPSCEVVCYRPKLGERGQ